MRALVDMQRTGRLDDTPSCFTYLLFVLLCAALGYGLWKLKEWSDERKKEAWEHNHETPWHFFVVNLLFFWLLPLVLIFGFVWFAGIVLWKAGSIVRECLKELLQPAARRR